MSSEEDIYLNEFNTNVDNANELNGYYKDAVVYLKNTEDLYNSYASKKDELNAKKNNIHGEIDLNDRIGYYQNESQENLSFWYSVLWYTYYFLVLVIILGIIFDSSGKSRVKKIVVASVAVVFPFLIKLYQRLKQYIYENYLKKVIA